MRHSATPPSPHPPLHRFHCRQPIPATSLDPEVRPPLPRGRHRRAVPAPPLSQTRLPSAGKRGGERNSGGEGIKVEQGWNPTEPQISAGFPLSSDSKAHFFLSLACLPRGRLAPSVDNHQILQ